MLAQGRLALMRLCLNKNYKKRCLFSEKIIKYLLTYDDIYGILLV